MSFLLLFEICCKMNMYSPAANKQTAKSKADNTVTRWNHDVVLVVVP